MSTRKLSSIKNLHNIIDDTSRVISQKSDLIKNLQNKKLSMISSVKSVLNQCRNKERNLYNRRVGSLTNTGLTKMNEYNIYLNEKHDEGPVLIGTINASKNFQQLDRVERDMYGPFLSELGNTCNVYSREISRLIKSNRTVRINRPGSKTHIRTGGLGRTNLDIKHGNGISVRTRKEDISGSPGHDVEVSSPKGSIRVSHNPSSDHRPVSPGPVYLVEENDIEDMKKMVPVRVQEVKTVRTVPVKRVVPVHEVKTVPVRRVVPVHEVKTVPVRRVVPVHEVKTVKTVPVRRIVPVQTVGRRATVVQDYLPADRSRNKLLLKGGTQVTILGYSGDWAYVETLGGRRGYVSRHFLR